MRNAYGTVWVKFEEVEFFVGMEKYSADCMIIFEYEAFYDEFGRWEIEDYKYDSIHDVTIYTMDGDTVDPDKELVDAMYHEIWSGKKWNEKIEQEIMDDIDFP